MLSKSNLRILALVVLVAVCSNSLGSTHSLGGVAPEDRNQLEPESQPEPESQLEVENQPEIGGQPEIREQPELVTVHTSTEQATEQQAILDPGDYVHDEDALARSLENLARTSPGSANPSEEVQLEQGGQSEENNQPEVDGQPGSEIPHTSTELAPLQHPSFNAEDYISDEAAFERLLEQMRWEEYNRYFIQSPTEGAGKQTDSPTEARTDSPIAGSDAVTESQETSLDCPICLYPMEDSNTTETPCKHLFHAECIDMWLAARKKGKPGKCPVCRVEIMEAEPIEPGMPRVYEDYTAGIPHERHFDPLGHLQTPQETGPWLGHPDVSFINRDRFPDFPANFPLIPADPLEGSSGVVTRRVVTVFGQQIVIGERPQAEVVRPEVSQAEGNQSEGNQPEGNQPEGNQPEGNQPEGNQPEGNQPEGNQPEGNQPEGNQPEGNQPVVARNPARLETDFVSSADYIDDDASFQRVLDSLREQYDNEEH